MILPWRDMTIDGGPPISTAISEREAEALEQLATGLVVLEVGSAYGYSSIVMARTALHVVACDPHSGLVSIAGTLEGMRHNLQLYGCEHKVSLLLGRSEHALPALGDTGAKFDFIFIDGDHAEEAVYRDLISASLLLAHDGVLACHDYGEETCPGVRAALDRWAPEGPPRLIDTLWISR